MPVGAKTHLTPWFRGPSVKYVLDTHAWLWSVLDDPRLSRRARAALAAVPEHERVGVPAI